MKQLGLLEPEPDTALPNAVKAAKSPVKAEHDRRNSNAQRILDRLKQGPALNWELCYTVGVFASQCARLLMERHKRHQRACFQ